MTGGLPVIGIAGMTHLGLNTAAAIADRGFATLCFDSRAETIDMLRGGTLPVFEPDLPDLYQRNASRISFTNELAALDTCDIVYIATDVPTDDAGQSDLTGIRALINAVAKILPAHALLIVLCQVPPGFTRSLTSVPTDRLFYQVETLVFGRAVERACRPERYIIGCADPGHVLPLAYTRLLEAFGCPILPMRYESAELVKISINLCLVASISVANSVAEICEQIGADWSEMAPALRLDQRIGPHAYLDPGLGISGGNLERDLATIAELASTHGADGKVIDAWIEDSRYRKNWTWRTLSEAVLSKCPNPVIGVLGLAYKKDTHSTKNSPALALLSHLDGHRVRVYDPVVPAAEAGTDCLAATSAMEVAKGADVVLIMTAWDEFAMLAPSALAETMTGAVLIDPYGVIDGEAARDAGLTHHRLGRPPLSAQDDQ